MKTKISLLIFSMAIGGCNFNKSAKVDLLTGLTTTGDLISCDDVYLTVNDRKVNRNTFTYGEEFYLNFNNIEGFKKENGRVFPVMDLIVTDTKGDTLLLSTDLYKNYPDGINLSPLLLQTNITVATPIHSNGEYSLSVNISDKKDKGSYKAKLKFKVVPNENILVTPAGVGYNEIYLFSTNGDKVITDNKVKVNEKIYLLFEGLSGFKEENEKVFPGLSIKASDNIGELLLKYDDLFSDYSTGGISVSDFVSQVSSNIIFSSPKLSNPVKCIVSVWDKKSDAKISASFDLTVEQ